MTPRSALLLSTQRAVLGAIGPGVIGVAVDLIEDKLTLRVYYDVELSVDEREALEAAASEIVAGFPSVNAVDVTFTEWHRKPLREPGPWAFKWLGY